MTEEHTWCNVIAESLLGAHALADKRGIEAHVICTLKLLTEQLTRAFHGKAALLPQLHTQS